MRATLWCFSLFIMGCSNHQVTGGLAFQRDVDTNQYGSQIGIVRYMAPIGENFYVDYGHISGINTPESDFGLNWCGGGFVVDF